MAQVDQNKAFTSWLSEKLDVLKIDENIYLNYILSVLEGDESREEKLDILKSVLVDTGSSEDHISKHCNEILDKWQLNLFDESKQKSEEKVVENVDQKLARLLEANVRLEETTHTCNYTDEQLKIREAILAKYSHADEPDDEFEEGAKEGSMGDLEKNTNASAIHQAEKEKREKAKLENQKKKERDKLEREKQKLTQQEKKEARRKKAQKVEHHKK